MSAGEKRTVFVHVHVPKCGGTSFNEVLWRNFRSRFHMEYGHFNMLRPSADEVEWSLRRHFWLEAIAGHRFHTRLRYEGRDHRLVAISFVRDPIQHFTSTYNFMRRVEYPGLGDMSIAETARWLMGDRLREAPMKPWFGYSQLEHLDPAMDLQRIERLVTSGSLQLFPTERFDDACLLLGRLFPNHFRHTAFRVKNISPRLQEADTEVNELVREHRSQDFALWDFAQQFLDDQIAERFSPPELAAARKQQRRRCRFLGSPLGEAGYVVRRFHDMARQYAERRRWIGRQRG